MTNPLPIREQYANSKTFYPIIVDNLGSNTITLGAFTSTPAGIVFGATQISGNQFQALTSGGAAGTDYVIEAAATLSNGEVRVGRYILRILA